MSKDLADICRTNGVPVGDASDVADAVVRCATDETICGKSSCTACWLCLTRNTQVERLV